MRNQNGKFIDVFHRFATAVSVLKLASDVCESIPVEDFFTFLIFDKNFHVSFSKWFLSLLVNHFQLTKLLVDLDAQFGLEEGFKLLDIIRVDFNDKIFTLKVSWQFNSGITGVVCLLDNGLERHNVAELLRLIFHEWAS